MVDLFACFEEVEGLGGVGCFDIVSRWVGAEFECDSDLVERLGVWKDTTVGGRAGVEDGEVYRVAELGGEGEE